MSRRASLLSLSIGVFLVFAAMAATAPPAARASQMLSGLALAVLAYVDFSRPRAWSRWTLCGLGVWLLFEPLVFWAPAAMFAVDQLAGPLVIVLATIEPVQFSEPSEVPPGWSYNPSTWSNRVPIVLLAVSGFFAARAMSAFQLGHIERIWEPFFSDGTVRVLTSDVAKAFPISDAGLGAVAYLLEGISGLIGDQRRWRTMPWMVCLFFVLVVPAGVVSIVLIMLQPVAVGAWCTLCLFTAAVTLVSIPPAVDEVVASFQHLIAVRRAGGSVWRAFWGYGEERAVSGGRAAHVEGGGDGGGLLSGIRLTWPLGISILTGFVLVTVPSFLDLGRSAANSNFITGALIVTFGVLATAEPSCTARLFNVPFGLWAAVSPLVFDVPAGAAAIHVALGLVAAAACLPRGAIRERYGGWERYLI